MTHEKVTHSRNKEGAFPVSQARTFLLISSLLEGGEAQEIVFKPNIIFLEDEQTSLLYSFLEASWMFPRVPGLDRLTDNFVIGTCCTTTGKNVKVFGGEKLTTIWKH